MGTPRLPLAASRPIIVGLAAGAVGAFAVLSVVGRAPGDPRARGDAHSEPPRLELAATERNPPPADAPRAGAGPVDVPAASEPEPSPLRRRDDLARAPAGVFARPPGASGVSRGAASPGAAPPAAEPRPPRSEQAAVDPQLAAARADAQLRSQQDLEARVEAIRGLVAQQEARRAAEAAAAQERVARTEVAVDALVAAQGLLQAGDAHVLELLDEASAALPFTARHALQNARSALAGEDLYLARRWLAVAVTEAQRAQ